MSFLTRRSACSGTFVAALALVGALLPLSVAGAQEADGALAAAPGAGAACTLSPSGDNTDEEFASCIQVDSELNRAPAIGETAILTVDVLGEHARPDTLVTIDLPANLEFAELPAGMSRGQAKAPHGQGQLQRASQRRNLSAAKPVRYQVKVRAVAQGPATIRTKAVAQGPLGRDAGADEVFITIGQKGKSSKFGHPQDTSVGAVAVPAGTPRGESPSVPTADGPLYAGTAPASAPAAPGGACVAGSFGYTDNTGVFRNVRNFGVEVWDDDSGADDHLANGLTDLNGNYNICVDNVDSDEGGNVDLFVTFASENSRWKVTNFSNAQYRFSTGTASNVSGTHNFGSLQSGDATLHPAVQAFDNSHDAYSFTPRSAQGCWDRNDTSCRQLKISWSTTSSDGNHMHPELDTVHLTASGASTPSIVVHEIGHWLMDEIYDDDYPPFPNCSPHDIPTASSQGCAWSEGFAEWYPARIYNDPTYYYGGGSSRDLEGNTWNTAGWDLGDTVEGRVASAMIDISDGNNEGPWDRYTEGDALIWNTFIGHRSATFSEFWQHRSDDGYVVDDANGLSALYQSTIDYGLRDPLGDYAPTTRSIGRPHNYRFDAVSAYWSVVAIRPDDDADIALFDDRGLTSQLESSPYGGTTMDFVAINGNVRSTGDYYPRVYGGSAPYAIELAQGSNSLSVGTPSGLSFDSGDVVAVRDVHLTAGVPYSVSADPADGQDIELFLMPAGVGTAARSEYGAASAGAAAGGTELLTYTPPNTGWHGVVVVNRSGSGTVNTTVSDGWDITATATGSGTGYIHSNPAGIDSCSTSCTHNFGLSGSVELSASAASGSTFTGWSGDCTGTGTCVLPLDSDKDVQANFALQPRRLTVDVQGTGYGTVVSSPAGIDCTDYCEADFDNGTSVTLYAYPDAGSTFAGWDITDCDAASTTCTLPMTADSSVRPTFNVDLQAVDDASSTNETNPVSISVLDNDLGASGVTEHTQGSRGSSVDCSDGYTCVYTPAQDVRSGVETFTYTIEAGTDTDTGTVTVTIDPCPDLAAAIAGQVGLVTQQTWVACSSVIANAASATTTPMMPTPDGEFAVLSNGDSALIDNAASDSGSNSNVVRGANDVSILKLDLDVPEGANCLSFDMVFASDEYPEFVGSQYNDAFIAELGTSTWQVDDAANIIAPDNFATDSAGAIMSINSAVFDGGGTTVDTGTGWNGATGLLHAMTPIAPGAQSLYLSIFDQGDHIYDSAAFVDGLQATAEPPGGCEAGVNVPPQHADTAAQTDEDTAVDITVATDVDSDALAVEVLTQPAHGTAAVKTVEDGQGVITYTPHPNWHGTDSLEFSAADGETTIDGLISITVDSVDDAPSASADLEFNVTTTGTTPLTLSGTDADGDDVVFEIVTGPTAGTLGTVGSSACTNGDCSAAVDYTPMEGAQGPDTFTFIAVDTIVDPASGDLTRLESQPQTVTVHIGESDTTAPAVTALKVKGGWNQATLQWINPTDDDFTQLVIVMTEGGTPAAVPADGEEIYNRIQPDQTIGTSYIKTGLSPARRYTFTAFSSDDADPPNVHRTFVRLRGTKLTLAPKPGTVVGTQQTTLTALLKRDDGTAVAGQPVKLFGKKKTATTFAPLTSAKTATDGTVTFTRSLSQHWDYRVKFLGAGSFSGSQSIVRTVQYKPALTGALAKSSIPAGKSTALKGTISPHYKGRRIYLQKLTAAGWSDVTSMVLGAPTTVGTPVIKYSFTVTGPKGLHSFRVRFPAKANVHLEAVTPKRVLTVTAA